MSVNKWFYWNLPSIRQTEQKPMSFRVWFSRDDAEKVSPDLLEANPVGISARSVRELKHKAVQARAESNGKIVNEVQLKSLAPVYRLVKLVDGTSIIDDDYLRQLTNEVDLVLLEGQRQTWNCGELNLDWQRSEHPRNNDTRRPHIEPACEQVTDKHIAKFAMDVYRGPKSQIGCVRFTTTTGGRNGMSVTYEMRLGSARMLIYCVARWTGVALTWCGRALLAGGDYLKKRSVKE